MLTLHPITLMIAGGVLLPVFFILSGLVGEGLHQVTDDDPKVHQMGPLDKSNGQ